MELQSVLDAQQPLAARVERMVREKTSGLIRDLRVTVMPGEIAITGRAATYYAKQLATHAALDACEDLTLTNDIEVF
ncbi:MAG: hypothetical protein HY290_08570 [Planctomycetia bacterium]|nr:hypothetical protein [Planctomycetia bacterium]